MKKIEIISSVVGGNLKRNRNLIKKSIASFEGKTIKITLAINRKQRSHPQNKYYHGVVVVLFQEAILDTWGELWSKEKVHDFLKAHFLYNEKYNEETGEVVKTPKSTTECTTVEFEEFLEECRKFAKEWFNVDIPLPNEDLELEFK